MSRPVKWSRDLHPLRDTANRSRTETWSRADIEHLFGIGASSAQYLMKAIGNAQTVGGTHFVDRGSLLGFLDAMITANSVDEALQQRLIEAEPAPRPKALQIALPEDLRRAMLPDLPANVKLAPGRIEITAESATGMVESLFVLAMVMQTGLKRWQRPIETPRSAPAVDEDLRNFLAYLRHTQG